jgi:hypothetical protein
MPLSKTAWYSQPLLRSRTILTRHWYRIKYRQKTLPVHGETIFKLEIEKFYNFKTPSWITENFLWNRQYTLLISWDYPFKYNTTNKRRNTKIAVDPNPNKNNSDPQHLAREF